MPIAKGLAAILATSVVGAGCLAGCVADRTRSGSAPVATTAPPTSASLRPGDRLRITVFGEDRLTGDYEIDEAGFVTVPLVGPTKAADLSGAALQDAITGKLREAYLKDPKVSVDLLSKRPFYILGEVEKPGEYPYRIGLDIWRAMALAGGQTYRASTSTVTIQRSGESTFRDFKLSAEVPVGPGDVIRVPERWF